MAFGQLSASVRVTGQNRGADQVDRTLGDPSGAVVRALTSEPLGEVTGWPRARSWESTFPGHPCLLPSNTLSSDNHSGVTWIQLLRAQMNPTSRNQHSGA